MELIKKIIGLIAAFTNIFFYSSSIKPYIKALKGKITFEETPRLYVTSCYINCLIWYIYGRMLHNAIIQASFMISGIISLILILIYLIIESKRYLCDSVLNTFFVVMGTWGVYRALILIIDKIIVVGYFSIGTTLFLFVSPIHILAKIMKDKYNNNFAFYFPKFKYLFTCIFWLGYSVFIKDIYLAITNFIGIVFAIIYIFIYFCGKKKKYEMQRGNSRDGIGNGANDEIKKEEIPIKLDDDGPGKNDEKPGKMVNKLSI